MRQRRPNTWLSDGQLRDALGLTSKQWKSVKAAAEDASMPLHDYIRLMILVAAGHGGVLDHIDRAMAGSFETMITASAKGPQPKMKPGKVWR